MCPNFYHWAHCDHIGAIIQNGGNCKWWAYFGHSGSKHSECAQFLTIGHIVDPLQRTFKIYPIFNCWVHCGQVLSVPTMYSPCAHWVYGSLSPVPVLTAKGTNLSITRTGIGMVLGSVPLAQ